MFCNIPDSILIFSMFIPFIKPDETITIPQTPDVEAYLLQFNAQTAHGGTKAVDGTVCRNEPLQKPMHTRHLPAGKQKNGSLRFSLTRILLFIFIILCSSQFLLFQRQNYYTSGFGPHSFRFTQYPLP